MADSKREIERKYEATPETRLPDLTRAAGVSEVEHRGLTELDAVYYDTADLRLAAGSLTLRRRTGGDDAGWHLKFPVSTGIRDEIRAPLADTLPDDLAGLIRSRVRDAEVAPVMRLRSARDVCHLLDGKGVLLAELSTDEVHAERLTEDGRGSTAAWTEIEVELADDRDPAVLDAVERRLRKAGVRPAASPSKLARALAETAPGKPRRTKEPASPRTAGDHVLAYVRHQIATVIDLDPAVRRGLPDSVHRMRVATRRLRSAFKTYRKVLDRTVTDPIGAELKWLAAELGVDRDQEVLDERLRARIDALPGTLVLGPVSARLTVSSTVRRAGSRRRVVSVLDGKRYLDLLESLDALLADPPLRSRAARKPAEVLPRAVTRDYARLATRVARALEQPPGEGRDLALHEARKAAKRTRYAAEAARPALGRPARTFAKRVKAVQKILGDHQDSVVARDALRTLAARAHGAGESAFTWGLLYGQEEAAAADRERELPGIWARASEPGLRAALKD
ncbi:MULTISPECIES: CYTH and CHAD domain-containing protein [Streptomyces]|uniref:CHAD domain-containing protein n=1 Tax=Streptomyces clavifer TaxID=68188 RepID=A0ABS4VBX2_9ACTN|nr:MULTISPECIES: CYTH and CHAD domain-containing protein [Streptomyces]MBP2361407.1 CHAD domain-containing protein [Streptomyces clavifer]MDX2744211.1 CYTH and CHAD domain-containing protein [Streptomyces sp. NRRL_B-2557]MDX3062939.1 CYTH and CHAD domain-containing protein [Streptomyces sp. ND04-05B]WRY82067.1 CYTH and CHAD domain-containing protein [Streptomyces clavifer]GHA93067.1 CHAD domain-containing protein [Streptomyces clavifer]